MKILHKFCNLTRNVLNLKLEHICHFKMIVFCNLSKKQKILIVLLF